MKYKFIGIGVGPGDSGLLTANAIELLKNAEIITAPLNNKNTMGTAYKIAEKYINKKAEIIGLDIPMNKNQNIANDKIHAASEIIIKKLYTNDIIFLSLGDPSVYSSFEYIKSIVKQKGYEVVTIPGITSFCAAASATGISLCSGDENVAIIPYFIDENQINKIMQIFDAAIIMKVYKNFINLKQFLIDSKLIKNTFLCCNIGFENEKIFFGEELLKLQSIDYFSTIIIKNIREKS